MNNGKWIWLSAEKYPENQNTIYSAFLDNKEDGNYTVAEFKKEYAFDGNIEKVVLRVSGDTEFRLCCNGEFVATGPANVGGDFTENEKLRPNHYTTVTEIFPKGSTLSFDARVKMMPVAINEYSKGHGGFYLSGTVFFGDGTAREIATDETWLVRKNSAYTAPDCYDDRLCADDFNFAEIISDIWHCTDAPIKPRVEFCPQSRTVILAAGAKETYDFDFPELYAGFVTLKIKSKGLLKIEVDCLETDEVNSTENFVFSGDGEYIGLQLRSIGRYIMRAENLSGDIAEITLSVTATCYPATYCADTFTSDEELNNVLDLCRRNLKFCRQMIHLDSPLHSEPLACTGDYYIEMLMTAFSYADLDLAQFDILRTAEILRQQKGAMFHVTYSMIWLFMLYDAYLYTGNKKLLEDCSDAVEILLDKFEEYKGENGIIENPPSFMFVDWLYVDELSLHHPPKALGQTCLNMFWYGGLTAAEKIFDALGDSKKSLEYGERAENLKAKINSVLYDEERGLYFEGLNTPTPEHLIAHYMPQNVKKRYYRKHANILAVAFGVAENKKELLEKTLNDDSLGDFQPYFAHFVFQAVRNAGLSEKYTLRLLNEWKKSAKECSKGLAEGFITPEPGYKFDHSHAWAGTPLCSLPLALTGLEIIEPGFKKIKLNPNLLGLESAHVEIPTPYGEITVEPENGKEAKITVPEEITVQ